MAVAQDLPSLETTNEFKASQNSILTDNAGQQAARRPDRQREPDPGRQRGHLAHGQARRDRDRGQALLRPQGGRLPGHRARAVAGRLRRRGRPGRVHDHAAVRQERAAGADRPLALPEAEGGGARLPARAQVDQGQDPHPVPEHGLLRRGRLRHRVRRARLLRLGPPGLRAALRRRPGPGGGGAAGRHDRLALGLQPGAEPRRGARSAATWCWTTCASRASSARCEHADIDASARCRR